jgi:hypothetical protein
MGAAIQRQGPRGVAQPVCNRIKIEVNGMLITDFQDDMDA